MSLQLCKDGLEFIRQRFQDVWGIYRTDVTLELIHSRINLTLTIDDELIGWLGMEHNNEFTNACIKKGLHGVHLLTIMIEHALRSFHKRDFHAWVPILKTGSARAFITAGLFLESPPIFKLEKYSERNMMLIKLVIGNRNGDMIRPSREYIEQQIERIRGLRDELG